MHVQDGCESHINTNSTGEHRQYRRELEQQPRTSRAQPRGCIVQQRPALGAPPTSRAFSSRRDSTGAADAPVGAPDRNRLARIPSLVGAAYGAFARRMRTGSCYQSM